MVYPSMDPSDPSLHSSPIFFSSMNHPLTFPLIIVCKREVPHDTELVELQHNVQVSSCKKILFPASKESSSRLLHHLSQFVEV